MGLTMEVHRLAEWTPTALVFDEDKPAVRWCFTEGIEFTDPFFGQTIERCLRDPFRLLFSRETTMEVLADFATASPGLEPSGFIFHLSRCGSTLVTQMLAALSRALVISEPPVFDQTLRAPTRDLDLSSEDHVAWLKWMVSALGQRKRADQSRFVIKLDAWAIIQWRLIREAFPDTPCIFLYRDPLEVIASHLIRRGYHMIPGTLSTDEQGSEAADLQSYGAAEYCASVLNRHCQAALDAARAGAVQLVNYSSLSRSVPDQVAPEFGFAVTQCERALFAAVARRDAKNPSIAFVEDGRDKRERATPEVRDAIEADVLPSYAALEALRSTMW
jgi:gluconate kinase